MLVKDKSKEIVSDTDKPTNFIFERDNYHTLYTLNFTHKKKITKAISNPAKRVGMLIASSLWGILWLNAINKMCSFVSAIKIQGVGKARASQILASFELAKHYLLKHEMKINNTGDVL